MALQEVLLFTWTILKDMQICMLIRKKTKPSPPKKQKNLSRFYVEKTVATRVQFLSFKNVTDWYNYMCIANDSEKQVESKIKRGAIK